MRRAPLAGTLCLLLCVQAAASEVRRAYADRADGVSFAYPAEWLLNGDDDAATAKLRLADLGPPRAVVQLEGNFADEGPYRGTDFEAGAFAYTVVPAASQDACLALLAPRADDVQQPVSLRWEGLPASRLDATYTVAGTDDIHRVLAAYRAGRCLVFETVLIRKSVGVGIVALSHARWLRLRELFDGVMKSIRLTPPSADHP